MNKWIPVAALAAFLLSSGVLLLLNRGREVADAPVSPPAGEGLRLRPPQVMPPTADPKEVAQALEGATLPPGDAVLADALRGALSAGEAPSYRSLIDVPISANEGAELRDEVKAWVDRKMARFGFAPAQKKPTVVWRVQLDPAGSGAWKAGVTLRREGQASLERAYEVPAAWSETRLDAVFASDFAPPR
ncbi:MAG: hypothetical protein ACK4N5_19570 [Myxococcales bacterium]